MLWQERTGEFYPEGFVNVLSPEILTEPLTPTASRMWRIVSRSGVIESLILLCEPEIVEGLWSLRDLSCRAASSLLQPRVENESLWRTEVDACEIGMRRIDQDVLLIRDNHRRNYKSD